MPEILSSLQPGKSEHELAAIVAVLSGDAVSAGRLVALLDHFGSAIELLRYARTGVAELTLAAISETDIERAMGVTERWQSEGLTVFHMLEDRYPANLRSVYNRPPLLFVDGAWSDARFGSSVSVVGTRSATEDGLKRAFRLAKALAEAGITIVSGMAKGIDTAAHQGALKAGGKTVAVMGTGIRERYPRQNARLADQILSGGGALVSQFFPEQGPRPWTFPARNVTMSGLSLATVVVEAGPTSGAKQQAEAALVHGHSVFLPASLVDAHAWARTLVDTGFRGTKAILVRSADEVVSMLALEPPDMPMLTA